MLRSIFSLIQNIIDSEKEYNNKKSSTVIYLVSNPENNNLNMDLEIDGKVRDNVKSLKDTGNAESSGSFKITTEQGDTVTCKHFTNKQIKPKTANKECEQLQEEYQENVEKFEERTSFSNEEDLHENPQGDTGTTVKDLLEKLSEKQTKMIERDRDQITALMEQIQKMKKGMERLQEIAQQFNCSEKFKQDIDFLMKNVSPNLENTDAKDKKLSPTKL